MRYWLMLIAATLFCRTLPVRADVQLFESSVLPIFQAKCASCHGEKKKSADLDLRTAAALFAGGESGAAVIPGEPEESLLFEKVHRGEMPPEGNEPLSAAEIEEIREWIAAGAKVGTSDSPEPAKITQHQIIPLLLLRCTACHGGRRREADLDLRTKASILRGGKSGPAAVPGKPQESLLIRRIKAEEMPPRRQLVAVSVKPMEAPELSKLESWIAAGMPETALQNNPPSDSPDPLVTAEDREFWAFKPPQRAKLPLDPSHRSTNPIDLFVIEHLAKSELTLSPEADRVALVRRLYFDLIGLPPTPEEVEAFVRDPSPNAYEQLVDRLLASPSYGERWARHWLDVAGYADSEGAQNEDRIRPNMWRYRDYVVRAFNADKPYDRFLHQQIAGDELADYEKAPVITDEIYDNLVATGFLRTAPDRTFANITNFVPDRLEVISDEIQILGAAVFGLTLHCSRCHSHKFDPLPQRDYYRLAASLKDALDEHDWLGPEVRQLKYVTTEERRNWELHDQEINARLTPLKQKLEAAKADEEKKQLQDQIKKITDERRPEPQIRALWSRGDPSPTYILKRGNYLTAGSEVAPGVPAVLTSSPTAFQVTSPFDGARTTGRRLALARWCTSPEQPLTARVMVNRLWKHHFGSGLVATLGNFGKMGARPTHPELLDWLACEFMEQDWSMKAIHRLMVTSNTYKQSSQVNPELLSRDPENRLLSRMPLRRLEAECVRDALLSVAGRLDLRPFGPPDDVQVREDGLVTAKSNNGAGRRSIYVLHRRTKMPTILENFDSPQMGPNCIERGESIAAPQALHLLNNGAVHELAARFAERVETDVGSETGLQIDRIHQLAFGRKPNEVERLAAIDGLKNLTDHWTAKLGQNPSTQGEAQHRALCNYCHAIMNSAGFLYVD